MASLFLSSAQSSSPYVVDWMSREWYLIAIVATAFFAHPLSSIAQETRTQQVQLDQGWNLVSLNVRPSDSSLASIFGANADQILMVKDEDGDVYAPGEGIEQITTWRSGEGYWVQARTAITLEVTGTGICPDSASLLLEEGGNIVPYFSFRAQSAESALTSVEEALVVVEADGGERYSPSASTPSLDSLRPGQAYKVYVDRSDTLRYPRMVSTLDEALADGANLSVGQTITIGGERGAGDTFEVTSSGNETNGGTVFVFDEDVSAEKTYTTNDFHPNLPDTDLVWGTFSARVGAGTGEVVQDLDMHGSHPWTQSPGDPPFIDFKGGELHKYNSGNLYDVRNFIGDGPSYDITYRYKTATSDRRLERQGVTNSVNIDWWGAPEADPNNPTDAWPYIGWALHVAGDLYQEKNIDWAYVDINGEYYYHHTIVEQEGTMLRGVDTDRSVPGESWTTNAKLTVTPGKALYHKSSNYDQNAENDVRGALASKAQITNQYLAEKWGIQDVELDGNYPNNKHPFNRSDFDSFGLEGWLQNSGDWCGFNTTGKGSKSYASDAVAHFDNVYVHHYGANGMATSRGLEIDANNVRGANSVRNHSLYHFWGDNISNITAKGYSWAVPLKLGSKDDERATYSNVTYEAGDPNPEGYVDSEVFNIIGGNLEIDGITIDMRGGKNRTGWINDKATTNEYRNATIYTSTAQSTFTLQAPRAKPNDELFENFTIYSNGDGPEIAGRGFTQKGMTFKDFTIEVGQNASGASTQPPLGMTLSDKFSNLDRPGRLDIKNLNYKRTLNAVLFKGGGGSDDVKNGLPRDFFISGSSFDNSDLFDSDGRWSLYGDTDENFRNARFYLHDTTIELPSSYKYPTPNWEDRGPIRHGIGSADGAHAPFKLRDVTDQAGRVSDQTGTYTSDASDEGNDFVLISTNLIYRAWGRSATVTSGNRTVQSVEVVNSDGTVRSKARGVNQREPYLKVNLDNAIQNGNTITVDWEAYATPLNEYQTTGAFVSRPVYDRTSGSNKGPLTSGDGPFTFDLRGVVVSQESKDVPNYTVSSGDTSVATVSMQGDGYTLELTEQGTGTATITVAGEILGIGTATDTFKVTVE